MAIAAQVARNNSLQELRATLAVVNTNAAAGGPYEDCVKDAVSAFDASARAWVQQLVKRIPMRKKRRDHLANVRFHNLLARVEDLKAAFAIDLFSGLKKEDTEFAMLMFHRRHVYEHNGGEADERYIKDSGDTSVQPKQVLRETAASATRLAELVEKMAANFHEGIHDIFNTEQKPLQYEKTRQERLRARAK